MQLGIDRMLMDCKTSSSIVFPEVEAFYIYYPDLLMEPIFGYNIYICLYLLMHNKASNINVVEA